MRNVRRGKLTRFFPFEIELIPEAVVEAIPEALVEPILDPMQPILNSSILQEPISEEENSQDFYPVPGSIDEPTPEVVVQPIPEAVVQPIPRNSGSRVSIPPKVTKKDLEKVIRWREGSLQIPDRDTQFCGEMNFPENLENCSHPYEYFSYFFDDAILEKIRQESILYSVQKDPSKPYNLTKKHLIKYFGILILSSAIHVSSMRDYWHPILGN